MQDSSSTSTKTKKGTKSSRKTGARFAPFFVGAGENPYNQVKWVKRSSQISGVDGKKVFAMDAIEVPEGWSQLATDIAVSKYFRKAGVPKTGHETSVRQLVYRVAHTIREAGEKLGGYFATASDAEQFEKELVHLLLNQKAAFNSPVWFNCGLYHEYGIVGSAGNWHWDFEAGRAIPTSNAYEHPQCSACFIQSVDDDLMSIFELGKNEARIFKYGSGTGTNFSKIRGAMEKLSGGGLSSGLMSFLEVLDKGAGATKSGGTTRRAAKMVCLDMDHPEIVDFINWKVREEKKVAALVGAGYSSDFNGEAYRTVAGQNSNNSVRVPDEFMDAVARDGEWKVTARTDGSTIATYQARDLWQQIAEAAWACADPGVQFDSTIQKWHTAANTDRINGSNPCSEYMFLDDSACNLSSLNLVKFLRDDGTGGGTFDVAAFRHACRIMFTAQEILVDFSSYPTEKIARNSHDYRPLGLGYANLGTMLMIKGIPYDSPEALAWTGVITALLHGEAFRTSAEMAENVGPFPGYARNAEPMMRVVRQHQAQLDHIVEEDVPSEMLAEAYKVWTEVVERGDAHGFRNAQATVLAPTGTIGLLMDCDTTGIEPDFALVKFKKLAGGGYFKIVNQSVPKALKALGYTEKQISAIVEYAVGTMTLENAPHINTESLRKRGLNDIDFAKINGALPGAFDLNGAIAPWVLGDEGLGRLGLTKESLGDRSVLETIGFTEAQIKEASLVTCGRMMLEGAPHLRPEHLPVFDCANKCGAEGQRFIEPMAHIRMMAAAQAFISGAISKTVNLPFEATVDDIKRLYTEAWKLGVKAVAVYRDGSKLSQPLSGKSDKASDTKKGAADAELAPVQPAAPALNERGEQLIYSQRDLEEAVARAVALAPARKRKMPQKRNGLTIEARVGGHQIFLRSGEYDDGRLGEIFIDMHKEGATLRSLLNCFAISVSMGLQYGVPLEDYVEKFTFTRFEPQGLVDHPNIKSATSILDYMFRVLGMEYLGKTDFVHVKPAAEDLVIYQRGNEALPSVEKKQAATNVIGGGQMDLPLEKAVLPQEKASGEKGLAGERVTGERTLTEKESGERSQGGSDQAIARENESAAAAARRQLGELTVKPVTTGSSAIPGADPLNAQLSRLMGDAPMCSTCGHVTVRNGSCYRCLNCGNSMGCS